MKEIIELLCSTTKKEDTIMETKTVFTMSDYAFWKALLTECGYQFKVTNLSDYSGVEIRFEWCEKKTA